jgi:hypothetical protein
LRDRIIGRSFVWRRASYELLIATAKVQVSAGTNEKLPFLDENMFMAGYGCLSGRFFRAETLVACC